MEEQRDELDWSEPLPDRSLEQVAQSLAQILLLEHPAETHSKLIRAARRIIWLQDYNEEA